MRKVNPFMTVVMILSVMFLISACSKSSNNRAGSTGPQTNMSDSEAEKVVKDRFNADPQLSASNIKVSTDTKNNEIRLSGTVNSEEAREKAVRIAQNALPQFSLRDTIDVEPSEMARSNYDDQRTDQARQAAKSRGDSIGDSAEDAHIYSEIRTKLSNSNAFQDVKIDVDKGVVTLHGDVPSGNEKAEAQRAAQEIKGVKRVDNKLDINSNPNRQTRDESQNPDQQRSPAR
jgi:osmotically-inducible protein OsmY